MSLTRESTPRTASPPHAGAATPRILAVDYGRARIGLALADEGARLAQPLETLARKNRNADMRRLREIVRAHSVSRIVMGLPLRMDGTRGEMAQEVERFAERLRKQLGLPVELVDERLTSWEAEGLLAKQRKKNRKRIPVDAVAAAVILREYLGRQSASQGDG